MWVFRTHKIELPYSPSYRRVRNRYLSEVERGVLPTETEMESWLDRKMKNRSVEATFSVHVAQDIAEASMVESSMESYYEDNVKGPKKTVVGTRTRKRIRCVVCMRSAHTKIKVEPCRHIFHRKCVEKWLRWKGTCPICLVELKTINLDSSSCNVSSETKES